MKKIILSFAILLAFSAIVAVVSSHLGAVAGMITCVAPLVSISKPKKGKQSGLIICMIWKLSGLLSDVAGKFGGSTVFAGRTGLTMRNVRRGKNPNTANQIGRKAQFTIASSLWRTLLAAERLAWNAEAKLRTIKNKVGEQFTGSGAAFFAAINDTAGFVNFCRELTGAPAPLALPIVMPPSLDPPVINGNLDSFDPSHVGALQAMIVDVPKVTAGDVYIIEATPQLSAGVSFAKGQFRPITSFAAGNAQPAEDILAAYQAQYGDLVAGKKIFIRGRYYSLTGQSNKKYYSGVELNGIVRSV